MAKIVAGLATAHGPQLHTTPEQWLMRTEFDRRARHPFRGGVYGYDELVELRKDEDLAAKCTPEAMAEAHARCQAGMKGLADVWAGIDADVAVILGNDQQEIYGDDLSPVFMVYYGAEIPHHPSSEEGRRLLPPGIVEAEHGHAPDHAVSHAGHPELARHVIAALMAAEFDVTASPTLPAHNPKNTGISHAFGHVYRNVMRDRVIPNVPIYQNTFYPPNQPSARRVYDFGKAVGDAIRGWRSDARVAVFASGGMTHFAIDEAFDRRFVRALAEKDADFLRGLPLSDLQAGTSELKTWITLAGVLEAETTRLHEIGYIPCYRTPAGTGTAQGMYWWQVD